MINVNKYMGGFDRDGEVICHSQDQAFSIHHILLKNMGISTLKMTHLKN